MTVSQASLLQRRSTAALVSQYILELAEPRPASGNPQGAVGVIPNGADQPQSAPS
jgi:hypothetical protein